MTKRQLIDEIGSINRSARAEFLARFDEQDLTAYLHHLQSAQLPRLHGDAGRFAKYFLPRRAPRAMRQSMLEEMPAEALQPALTAPLFH